LLIAAAGIAISISESRRWKKPVFESA